MYETLLRPIEVFQIPSLPDVAVVSEKIKKSEQKREEKRLRQIAANKAAAAASASAGAANGSGGGGGSVNAKRKRDGVAEDLDDEDDDDDDDNDVEAHIAKKRFKTDPGVSAGDEAEMDDAPPVPAEDASAADPASITDASTTTKEEDPSPPLPLSASTSHRPYNNNNNNKIANRPIPSSSRINVSKSLPEVRGHTSYLTFACLIPIPVLVASVPQDDAKTKSVVNP